MTEAGSAARRTRSWFARCALGVCLAGFPAPLAQAAASARPDRALYEEAKAALATLKGSPRLQTRRGEWEKSVLRFRRVVVRYPQSGYCDNALLAIGDVYREMAERFKAPRYNDDAVAAYRSLASEYPSSSLGEPALFAVFEIARASGDRKRLSDAARAYLDACPDAKRAVDVKAALRKSAPAQAASLPSPPPPGLAQVFNLRFWSGDASTRIVLDVEKEVPLRHDRISGPDRLWVDLIGTRLHPNLKDRLFPVGDGLLEKIRIGQNKDDVVRVVLDFRDVKDYGVVYLKDPTRLVIDVRGVPRPAVATLEGAPAPPARSVPAPVATPSPAGGTPPPVAAAAPTPGSSPAPAPDGLEVRPVRLPPRRTALLTPPDPQPTPATRRPAPDILVEAPEVPAHAATSGSARAARSEPIPPQPPAVNRAGSYSLARQLGLGARKIVIDAGHGGHDPGTIGRAGLQEKDLVLDVAQRLETLVRSELGAEVVMTRGGDLFVPLEERTAIANSKGADLFLSIHANSSRNPSARGIETYFLNFAVDPHAEEVAARENAISAATLKDLQGLVKAITLNSKIDESRDFASSVQEALVGNLKPRYAGADRGVHTAPFYVLIGANMPSVLAEIAFVSNPDDEKVLATPDYRDRIARSLLEGVRSYLEALNRTQTRQLTGSTRGATVASKKGRR
jgi:N-acetylmuramoyl-L-alanine amidase